MVDWDVMNHAKQIISVLPEHIFWAVWWCKLGSDHGGRGGGGGGGGGRGGGGIEGIGFMAFNTCKNLNYMSSNCIN